jgi:hypothetical protein
MEGMTTGTILILAGIGAIIIAIAAVFIIKFLKGNLKIKDVHHDSNNEEAGITGILVLETKKDLESEGVFIALVGNETYRTRSSDGSSSSRTEEIYRQEVRVEESTTYSPNQAHEFSFQLRFPDAKEESGSPVNTGNAKVDNMIGMAASMMNAYSGGRGRTQIKWTLEAHVDLPGLDITTSQKLHL